MIGELGKRTNLVRITVGIMSLKILKLGKYSPIAVNYKE